MQIEVLNKKHNIVAVDMPDRKRNGGICVIYGPYTDTIMINKDSFDPGKIAEVIGAYLDLKALGGGAELGVKGAAKNDTLRGVFDVVDQIARIRRHLCRHRRV